VNDLLAAYTCTGCEVAGRADRDTYGRALCWCCGQAAVITALVSPIPVNFGAALAAALASRSHP